MGRHGVTPSELSRAVEALYQGTKAGELVADGLVSRVVARFPERLREDRERLAQLPVTTAQGPKVFLSMGLIR